LRSRIYQLPPTFLQDLSRATFSNSEQQDLHLVKHTLKRWVEQLEAERLHNRSAEHKALLQLLKKEKLRYKSELNSLLHDNETV
jgi:phage portal protein BeeE